MKQLIKILRSLVVISAIVLVVFYWRTSDNIVGQSEHQVTNDSTLEADPSKEDNSNIEAETDPSEEDNNDIEVDTEPSEENIEEELETIEYEAYSGEIPHIFTHTLISYPEIKQANGLMMYDTDCINVTEFRRLLDELYKNGYSLVDINDIYEKDEQSNLLLTGSVQVPVGRKPLIFSVDDVVYDVKKRGNGMVDFLALDENNDIITGTYQKDGSIYYSNNNEFIPILEEFIKEHPDFSSNGARFTLCMTGFTGVFGYRTDRHYTGDREAEIQKAKKIADRLKELGYTFASHSYGHYDTSKHSASSLKKDLESFKNEVVPIIGETEIFVYPYGKIVYPGDERYDLMQDYGFRVFCSVSNFFYERDYEEGHSIYMTRVAVDGYSLRNYKTVLAPLFDTDIVIDSANR